jgi:TIR domain
MAGAEHKEEWITAAEAVRLLERVFDSDYMTQKTICRRAHAGLIRARAERFMIDDALLDEHDLPTKFWWAEGGSALEQDWTAGDFATWIEHRTHLRAFNVSFLRVDIEKLIPTTSGPAEAPKERHDAEARDTKWDVFISHASEDKDHFVRPLAESLRSSELRVWYDEFTLTVGDGLRQSIDQGLARSRFGVVVISPSFLQKGWPQRELDGLVAREINPVKVILPVWHNIDADQIRNYSPILADRLAVSSSKGIDHVTTELLRAIRKDHPTVSRMPTGSQGSSNRGSLARQDSNRPLRFVQNEQQSFWAPSKRGDEPGTQVAGHWHVTNTSDQDVVLLRVRLDGHTSAFGNIATEGMTDGLFSSTHPIPAHRMLRVAANLFYYPAIISGTEPLVVDAIFTDNYEQEHRKRSTFHFVARRLPPKSSI